MSRVGADGKIPYLPPYYAKARSAHLKKKTLSSAYVSGGRLPAFYPLFFTMELSLMAAGGKSGPLNCFIAGTVASALTCPARSPLRRCVSSLFMGSAASIGYLFMDCAASIGKLTYDQATCKDK